MTTKLKLGFIPLLSFLFSITSYGQFDASKIPNNVEQMTGMEGGAGKGKKDSDRLNDFIETVSNSGGGIIRVRSSNNNNKKEFFLRDIVLRDKIELQFDSDITLVLPNKRQKMFDIGETVAGLKNVAVTSSSGRFKIELRGKSRSKQQAFRITRVENFKISNITIRDNFTFLSNIVLQLRRDSDNRALGPKKGVIENITSTRNDAGYGIIQAQAADDVRFNNLKGTGGVTLRLESGAKNINRKATTTLAKIRGNNIEAIDGIAAVSVSPHRVNQRDVDLSGVKSTGCFVTVKVARGFKDGSGTVNNVGKFSSVRIRITESKGGSKAQIFKKDQKFYTCGVQNSLNFKKGVAKGRSLAPIKNTADSSKGCSEGCYGSNVTGAPNGGNFDSNKKEVTGQDTVSCGNNSGPKFLSVNDTEEVLNAEIYPNPTADVVNVLCEEGSDITIHNGIGAVVTEINNTGSTTVDVSNLVGGVYFVKITSKTKTTVKKLIIK